VEYHQNVWPGRKLPSTPDTSVMARQVRVLRTTTVPAGRAMRIAVTVSDSTGQSYCSPLMLEGSYDTCGVTVHDSLVQPDTNGKAVIIIQNDAGFTERLDEGSVLGEMTDVLEVVPSIQSDSDVGAVARQVRSDTNYDNTKLLEQKRLLAESFSLIDLPSRQKDLMYQLLCNHHDVFVLSGERGETDLIQMDIEMGDATPIRQHPHRMPYSAREEVARQLKKMPRDVSNSAL